MCPQPCARLSVWQRVELLGEFSFHLSAAPSPAEPESLLIQTKAWMQQHLLPCPRSVLGEGSDAQPLPRGNLLFQPHTQFPIQPPLCFTQESEQIFCQSYKFPSSHFHQFLLVLSAARCYSPLILLVQHCCSVLV